MNLVNAMFKTAQLIVLWPHGDHGLSAIKLVVEDLLNEPELFNDHPPTEEFHAVQPLNVNHVMTPHAQLIA